MLASVARPQSAFPAVFAGVLCQRTRREARQRRRGMAAMSPKERPGAWLSMVAGVA